ncbi:MAG: NADH-quinone oxidoreductase subunit NuoG [Acidimicrobiales bacterium]
MADQNGDLSITVDGRPVPAKPGEFVIAAADRAGIYIPHFCWHPRMSSVGMCRQCLVEVDGPRGPSLVVSCMTTVADGQVVHTESPTVKKAQEGVLEFLLANHPLDCPVCDKGGECPLQDQAFSHGPGESRFVEEKRHYAKPIPVSSLVLLDRERCILCDRCTRFAEEVAGDPLIQFTHRGSELQVLTFPDEPFSSYFSGNTVQICPVGALTATPYRFKARPWDLDESESTCTTCAVGCRMAVQSSRNQLVRYQGVDADGVNWGWLCDKGRFGFEAVNSPDRISAPLVRQGDELIETTWSAALTAAAGAIKEALADRGSDSVAVLGGARGTNEDAYAWAKLAKAVIGTDHVDAQLADGLDPSVLFGLPRATIDETCASKTIVLFGPDLKEELPVLYLRIRDAAERRQTRLVEISPTATGLTRHTYASLRYRPGEQGALISALLAEGPVPGLDDATVAPVRAQLRSGGSITVVVGRASLADRSEPLNVAVGALARLDGVRFLPVARRGNVHGALDMGMAPGLLPGRRSLTDAGDALRERWASVPTEAGLDATGILRAAADGAVACLVLLGSDPLADFPDRDLARRALVGAGTVVAVDTHHNASNAHADVILAAAAYGEKAGTTTNVEGRVSRVSQKVTARGLARADWIIAAELAVRLGADLGLESLDAIRDEIVAVAPSHSGITAAALDAQPDGVVASGPAALAFVAPEAPADPPKVDAYALRLVVSRVLYDAGVALSKAPDLAPLAPGTRLHLNGIDHDRLGITPGATVRVSSARTNIMLAAERDDSVPRGSAWIAFNQPDAAIAELIDLSSAVTDVRVETL